MVNDLVIILCTQNIILCTYDWKKSPNGSSDDNRFTAQLLNYFIEGMSACVSIYVGVNTQDVQPMCVF